MSASLVWRPVPVDPQPLGTAKHPLLGLVLLALETDEASLHTGLAVAKGDDAVTFLRGARAALPTVVARHRPDAFGCQHAKRDDQPHTCHHPDYWRLQLSRELADLLDAIDQHGEVLIEVRR